MTPFARLSQYWRPGETELSEIAVSPVTIEAGTDSVLLLGDVSWRGPRAPVGVEGHPALRESFVIPNLEGPLRDNGQASRLRPSRVVGLWNSPSTLEWLKGFRGLAPLLANNHIDDYIDGLAATTRHLEAAEIRWVGAGANSHEASRPLRLHMADGRSVLILAAADRRISARAALRNRQGSYAPSLSDLRAHVRACRQRFPDDTLVLAYHWGVELEDAPSPEQRRIARRLLTDGVDIIAGNHPHVWQGWEKTPDGLCVYSLGNFLVSEGDFSDGRLVFPERSHEGYGLLLEPGDMTLLRFRLEDLSSGSVRLAERYSWATDEWSGVPSCFSGEVDDHYERWYVRSRRLPRWYPIWLGTETRLVRRVKLLQLSFASRLRWAWRRASRYARGKVAASERASGVR